MKNLTKIVSLFTCLVLLLSLTALTSCNGKEPAQGEDTTTEPNIETKNLFTVAVSPADKPFVYYHEDKVVGLGIDLTAAIIEALNMELELKVIPENELIQGVIDGHYRAAFGFFDDIRTNENAETMKKLRFSNPLYIDRQVVLVKSDSEITQTSELTGKTVGVKAGLSGETIAKEELGENNVKSYDSYQAAIDALMSGGVAAAIVDSSVAESLIASNTGLTQLSMDFSYQTYCICVLSKEDLLINNINAEILTIGSRSGYATMLDKYFS